MAISLETNVVVVMRVHYSKCKKAVMWGFISLAACTSHTFEHTYFDPLKPHFYIVKLGFTGVYIIFLFLLKNIDCGYSLEPPRRGGSNEYPQSMF